VNVIVEIWTALYGTLHDVLPIIAILGGFQYFVIRKPMPNWGRTLIGLLCVVLGMALFLFGLEKALFPIGRLMAAQLTHPEVTGGLSDAAVDWTSYLWVYVFAFLVGVGTTMAEPALIAVAIQANKNSAGAIGTWGLRLAVALGVAIGISLGTWRIVVGAPIHYFIIAAYIVVVAQTYFAPRLIIPLAYDSGGVSTSTVTVPLVAALGLGLAEAVPGRDPLIDGFGLIAFACLFPIITVMAYAQLSAYFNRRPVKETDEAGP